ncbi:MAG TPA: hypothetical protein VH186_16295 [Chloroflexia bacterium]|nr:hypothetical protein [Chloroflexia bacterium]
MNRFNKVVKPKALACWLVLFLLLTLALPSAFAATLEEPALASLPAAAPTKASKTPAPTPKGSLTPGPTVTPGPTPTPAPKVVTLPPAIKATSAIVVDADTGRILYAKNEHVQRPQASTTKLVTALTLLSMFPTMQDLQAQTTVVQDDLVGEANMGLRVGERIKLSTLLLGLLTNSANEAGMALARYAGQFLPGPASPVDRFVAAMNSKALSMGMYETHFMNPHGLDQPGHYTSAYDLAISGWYALQNPLLMQLAQFKSGRVDGHDIYNVDSFLFRYPGATGLKPGWTDDAGRCWVATATNYGHTLIGVIMNTDYPPGDIDPLMDYGFTLITGRAEQSVANLNLGYLGIPNARPNMVQARVTSNLKSLQTAVKTQLEFTLRLVLKSVRL